MSTYTFGMCRFVVGGGTYNVVNPVNAAYWSASTLLSVRFENCTGLLANSSAGILASTFPMAGAFVWDTGDDTRQFRIETTNYSLDWIDGSGIPTYNSTLPSGTAWAHRLTWQNARLSEYMPVNAARYGCYYKDTSAVKTITLEMLVPSAEIPDRSQIFAIVKYTGVDDVKYIETTAMLASLRVSGSVTALTDGVGTGSWTLNGATGVTSKKLEVTTTNAVKQNSEIILDLWLRGPPTSNYNLYINPDLIIS
jgi:hypothetical protein